MATFKSNRLFDAAAGGAGVDTLREPPSAEDIFEAARYLGIDPVGEPRFLWIAEEMLTAALPEGFTEHTDGEGNVYFFNSNTGESTWEHPNMLMCTELYNRLKAEGANSQLGAADIFYESKLRRRCFMRWKAYLTAQKQELRKGQLALAYAMNNKLAQYFIIWKDRVTELRRERRRNNLVVTYYQQRVLAKVWIRLAANAKDSKEHKSKLRRAGQYLRGTLKMKCMAKWKLFTKDVRNDKKRLKQAVAFFRSRELVACFSKWVNFVESTKQHKRKLEWVAGRFFNKNAIPVWNAWVAYVQACKEAREKAAAAMARWKHVALSKMWEAWTAFVVKRRKRKHKLRLVRTRWAYRLQNSFFQAWCSFLLARRAGWERAKAHWEQNCLYAYRRRLVRLFQVWKRYRVYRRRKGALLRRALLFDYDKTLRRAWASWLAGARESKLQAEKMRAAIVFHYDRVVATVFWAWRSKVERRRTLAYRDSERRTWMHWKKLRGEREKKSRYEFRLERIPRYRELRDRGRENARRQEDEEHSGGYRSSFPGYRGVGGYGGGVGGHGTIPSPMEQSRRRVLDALPPELANRAREREKSRASPALTRKANTLSPLAPGEGSRGDAFARMYAESLAHAVGAGDENEFLHDPRWKHLQAEAASSALAGAEVGVWGLRGRDQEKQHEERPKPRSYLDRLGFGDEVEETFDKDLSALDERWSYDEIAKEREREMKQAMDIAREREPFAYPNIGTASPTSKVSDNGRDGGLPTAEQYRKLVRKAVAREGLVVDDPVPSLLEEIQPGGVDDMLEIDFYSNLMDDDVQPEDEMVGRKSRRGAASVSPKRDLNRSRSRSRSVSPQRRTVNKTNSNRRPKRRKRRPQRIRSRIPRVLKRLYEEYAMRSAPASGESRPLLRLQEFLRLNSALGIVPDKLRPSECKLLFRKALVNKPANAYGLGYEGFLECLESVFDKLEIRKRAEAEVFNEEDELPDVQHVTRADKLQALADILDLEGTLFRARYEAKGGGGRAALPRPEMGRPRKKERVTSSKRHVDKSSKDRINRAGKAAPHGSVARQLHLLQRKLGAQRGAGGGQGGPESFDDDDGNRVVVHKHVHFS